MSSWTQADVDLIIGKQEAAKRTETPHTPRDPKTATTVGVKAERGAGMARAQPKRKKNTEYQIQKEFAQRMGQLYPHIIIFSDAAAHVAKSMIQQVRANALQSNGQKQPDMFIAQPSGDYAGLYFEWKSETPYKIDGVTLKKSDHVEAQAATMQQLQERGYLCAFVWTVEQALQIFAKYLGI